ncbi:Ig-like domain-containing protein [Fibrivirga algicola]|uniref:T9SS type A sorting domain-containing protein n=1 Tax=Fibrivirga algicola TaxID=2950420 RepID=A0ABX0QCT2_9BACT|nr:T9SS type A sorting domain-containing protein [Fibrivirga algicola]NID10209.1 T9SS type A sorting domain-containing protein [Fibrivirga algicola]
MTITSKHFGLLLLVLLHVSTAQAQLTLSLSGGDPLASPTLAFDGNVFQAGGQIGDAPIYAKFTGVGTRFFQIDSPGENKTVTVTGDGFFTIRPTGNMLVDGSLIKNFTGPITGAIGIAVKPLTISTISANVSTTVATGSRITISYSTGSGIFPLNVISNGFKAQLLDASGNFITDLLDWEDQYIGREQQNASVGGVRSIKGTIPSTVASGSYRVRVATTGLSVNVIGTPSSLFTIRNDALVITANPIAGTYCVGAEVAFPFSTSGTSQTGSSFKVQLVEANGTIIQDLSGTSIASPVRATIPTSLSGGSYRFRIVSIPTGITSNTAIVGISQIPTMTIANDSEIGIGERAAVRLSFTGTPPWTVIYTDYNAAYAPGYSQITTVSSNTVLVAPTFFVPTIYDKRFIKSFQDNTCGVSNLISGSAVVSIKPVTITTGSLSGSYCPGNTIAVSYIMSGSLSSNAIPQVQLSDANGDFANGQIVSSISTTNPINATLPSSLVGGTGYRLRVILQKPTNPNLDYTGSIISVASSITISRPEAPKVTDFSFCFGTTVTSPLSASGIGLKWYVAGITQPLAAAPIPSSSQASTYYVSQTVNGCESPLATINSIPRAAPQAPIISTVSLCQGSQGQFAASANVLWYNSLTGGVGTSQPPAINTQLAGDITVYASQTITGCESPRTPVKATVYPIPAAPLVQPATVLCQYSIANSLTATGTNLTWYAQSGKLAGAPIPGTLQSGSQSYSVSQAANNCESARTALSVIVLAAPTTPSANSVRYCVGDTPSSFSVSGTLLKWYTAATGGIASPSPPTISTQLPDVLTFYVSQTDNNNCESLRQPVSVTVAATPVAPTVTPNLAVCQSAVVGALSATPNTGLTWQQVSVSGSTDIAPIPSTAQPGSFTYLVTQKIGSCTSPAGRIVFTVNKTPDRPIAASPVNFCTGQTGTLLTANAAGRLTWYTNANHSGPAFASILPATDQVNVATYYVIQTDVNNCESPHTTVEVRVSARATARLSGDGDVYPGDSTAIRVRLSGDGPWTFTRWDNRFITTGDSLYVGWVKPLATRSYAITNLQSACGIGNNGNAYTLIVRPVLSVLPISESLLLKAYPNPTSGDVTVSWSSQAEQPVTIKIINAAGSVVKEVKRQAGSTMQSELFQLGTQPAGIYFLQITTEKNGTQAKSILKY